MKDNVCRFQLEVQSFILLSSEINPHQNVACEMIEMQNGDEVYHGITSENDGCMFKDPHSQIEGSSSYGELLKQKIKYGKCVNDKCTLCPRTFLYSQIHVHVYDLVEFDLEMYDYYVTNWVNASTTI